MTMLSRQHQKMSVWKITKFSSYSPFWRVASFKHLLTLCVCNKCIFLMKEREKTDFVKKPKLICGTPFGKVFVPKKWTSSNATDFGREGHIWAVQNCILSWFSQSHAVIFFSFHFNFCFCYHVNRWEEPYVLWLGGKQPKFPVHCIGTRKLFI